MIGTRASNMGKFVVWGIDSIVNVTMLVTFLLLFTYGCYALWDSQQLYQEAEASQYETYKPTTEDTISFEELQIINPEVFGWINVYGTHIDYPLLQADNDEKYINTNAKGEYSLSGSIFLDYRNKKDFSDFNSIIYGHHMDKNAMFGEIGLFKQEDYFNEHKYGNLYFDRKDYGLEFFAFMEVDAYDSTVYVPPVEGDEAKQLYLKTIREKSIYYREISLTMDEKLVLLSTCTSDSTNGRHVLVGRITEQTFPDTMKKIEEKKEGKGVDTQSLCKFIESLPVWLWIILPVFLLLLVAVILIHRRNKSGEREEKR